MKRSMITAVCVQAAVVAMVSAVKVANGDTIRTYTIVDYPAYQTDNAGGTDHVSGTITADETTQTIQSFTLAIQAAGGTTYTATSGFTIQPNVRVAITDTQILITEPTVPVPTYQDSSGGFLGLQANWGGSGNNYVSVSWMSEVAAGGYYYAETYAGNADTSHVATYASFADPTLSYTYATPTAGGGLMSTYPVVIAQVPEPNTLVLVTMAGLGLLCYAWRRRRS